MSIIISSEELFNISQLNAAVASAVAAAIAGVPKAVPGIFDYTNGSLVVTMPNLPAASNNPQGTFFDCSGIQDPNFAEIQVNSSGLYVTITYNGTALRPRDVVATFFHVTDLTNGLGQLANFTAALAANRSQYIFFEVDPALVASILSDGILSDKKLVFGNGTAEAFNVYNNSQQLDGTYANTVLAVVAGGQTYSLTEAQIPVAGALRFGPVNIVPGAAFDFDNVNGSNPGASGSAALAAGVVFTADSPAWGNITQANIQTGDHAIIVSDNNSSAVSAAAVSEAIAAYQIAHPSGKPGFFNMTANGNLVVTRADSSVTNPALIAFTDASSFGDDEAVNVSVVNAGYYGVFGYSPFDNAIVGAPAGVFAAGAVIFTYKKSNYPTSTILFISAASADEVTYIKSH